MSLEILIYPPNIDPNFSIHWKVYIVDNNEDDPHVICGSYFPKQACEELLKSGASLAPNTVWFLKNGKLSDNPYSNEIINHLTQSIVDLVKIYPSSMRIMTSEFEPIDLKQVCDKAINLLNILDKKGLEIVVKK